MTGTTQEQQCLQLQGHCQLRTIRRDLPHQRTLHAGLPWSGLPVLLHRGC